MCGIHVLLPDSRGIHRALDAHVTIRFDELGNPHHRRISLRVTDPHRGRQLRGESDEPRVRVVVLRSGLASCGSVVGERRAPRGSELDDALHDVDGTQCIVARQHLLGILRLFALPDHLAVRVLDPFDRVRLAVHTAIGNRLGARGHVERTELIRAGRQRRIRLDQIGALEIAVEVRLGEELRRRHSVHQRHDLVEADDLGESRVRAVDRQCRHATKRSDRLAHAIGDEERRLLGVARVRQGARQRAIDDVVGQDACFERRREDEHLHARSRLTPTEREVHLVRVRHESFTADHRADRTGLCIEREHRRRDSRGVVRHLFGCRTFCCELGVLVERGVDLQTAAIEARHHFFLGRPETHLHSPSAQVVLDELAEVTAVGVLSSVDDGRLLVRYRRSLRRQWTRRWVVDLALGFLPVRTCRSRLIRRDQSLIDESTEHDLVTLAHRVRLVAVRRERVVRRRSLHETGDERPLDQIQFRDRLAVVRLGSCGKTIGVVAEVHGVHVALEDLFLRQDLFEHRGVARLQDLGSPTRDRPAEEFVLGHLLGDRGCSLARTSLGIGQQCAGDRTQVHPVVAHEHVVFDREDRCDDLGRDGGDHGALGVLALERSDLQPVHVVDGAALGETAELVQPDGHLTVSVQGTPGARSHEGDERDDRKRPRHDHDCQPLEQPE